MNCKLWKPALPATFIAMIFVVTVINPYDLPRNDHAIFSTAMASSKTMKMIRELSISNNRILATPPAAKVTAGFLVIANKGRQDDRLMAIKFDGAEKSQIHEMEMRDGVMKMRQLSGGIEIPSGKTVTLEPSGLHLMFMGLKEQLKSGQSVPIKLVFSKAGEVTLNFPVVEMMRREGSVTKDAKDSVMKKGADIVNKGKEMIIPEK